MLVAAKTSQFIKDFSIKSGRREHTNVLFNSLQQAKLILTNFTSYNAKGVCQILNNSSRYSNAKILNFIKDTVGKRYVYTLRVGFRTIKITFVDYDVTSNKKSEYDNYVKIVNMVLLLLSHGDNVCSESLHIHVYMTKFKKMLPKHRQSVLSGTHINTGVSYRCMKHNQLAIYREEEWLRTLIHELQHAFGLDKNVTFMLPKIHIHSELLTSEGYVEFFAEYLNCTMCAYLNANGDEKRFQELFSLFSEAERRFSFIQANKVLWHMKMRYGGFFRKDNHYRERTNVFAYYFLNSYLWYDYNGFIDECLKNNRNMFEVIDDEFIRIWIEKTYKNNKFINELRENNFDYLENSMCMTIVEYK